MGKNELCSSPMNVVHFASLNSLRSSPMNVVHIASLNELRSYRSAQQPTVEYTTCISLRSTTYG